MPPEVSCFIRVALLSVARNWKRLSFVETWTIIVRIRFLISKLWRDDFFAKINHCGENFRNLPDVTKYNKYCTMLISTIRTKNFIRVHSIRR